MRIHDIESLLVDQLLEYLQAPVRGISAHRLDCCIPTSVGTEPVKRWGVVDQGYCRIVVPRALAVRIEAQERDSVPFADQSFAQHPDDDFRPARRRRQRKLACEKNVHDHAEGCDLVSDSAGRGKRATPRDTFRGMLTCRVRLADGLVQPNPCRDRLLRPWARRRIAPPYARDMSDDAFAAYPV